MQYLLAQRTIFNEILSGFIKINKLEIPRAGISWPCSTLKWNFEPDQSPIMPILGSPCQGLIWATEKCLHGKWISSAWKVKVFWKMLFSFVYVGLRLSFYKVYYLWCLFLLACVGRVGKTECLGTRTYSRCWCCWLGNGCHL